MIRVLFLIAACCARAEFLHIEVSMKDMNCASCSESLGKAFERMRGVKKVDVRIQDGLVALDLADQNRITLEQVWDKVKQIGFTPGETKVSVRGVVKESAMIVSVIDTTLIIEGRAPEGEVELKGTISPPPDPRTPVKLQVQ
jgi:copper chaperone CopZ